MDKWVQSLTIMPSKNLERTPKHEDDKEVARMVWPQSCGAFCYTLRCIFMGSILPHGKRDRKITFYFRILERTLLDDVLRWTT